MGLDNMNFVINESADVYREGDKLIVPVEMTREGVHKDHLKPSAAIKAAAERNLFENVPVILNHRKKDGHYLRVRGMDRPRFEMGWTRNSSFDAEKNRVTAEMVLNLDNDGIRPIAEDLMSGVSYPVSLGFYADKERDPGEFDGESYTRIESRLNDVDHLAILTEEEPACPSCQGPIPNSAVDTEDEMEILRVDEILIDNERDNMGDNDRIDKLESKIDDLEDEKEQLANEKEELEEKLEEANEKLDEVNEKLEEYEELGEVNELEEAKELREEKIQKRKEKKNELVEELSEKTDRDKEFYDELELNHLEELKDDLVGGDYSGKKKDLDGNDSGEEGEASDISKHHRGAYAAE